MRLLHILNTPLNYLRLFFRIIGGFSFFRLALTRVRPRVSLTKFPRSVSVMWQICAVWGVARLDKGVRPSEREKGCKCKIGVIWGYEKNRPLFGRSLRIESAAYIRYFRRHQRGKTAALPFFTLSACLLRYGLNAFGFNYG